MTKIRSIAGNSLIISAYTFLSRILGMVRDILRAEYFGVSPIAKAFIIAYKIPNTLRNLVAEGALTQAFVPIFTEYLYAGKEKPANRDKAFAMANAVITMMLVILIVLVITGELMAPLIVRLFSWQWQDDPTLLLTQDLTRMMFPYILFVSISSLFMGVLNTFRHFSAPALSPVLLNLAVIIAYIAILPLSQDPVTQVKLLSISVVVGGFLQFFLQYITARRLGYSFRFSLHWRHPAIKKIFTVILPAIFGSGIYQLNQIIDLIFAASIEKSVPGAVASLEYAVRLMQLPLGVFGVATSTAILPQLASLLQEKNFKEYNETLRHGLSLTAFLTFPAVAGLVVLAEPVIVLLFQRGAFDVYSTRITVMPLVYYALGIFTYSAVKIGVAAFYSFKDSKTPVKLAAIVLSFTLILNLILIQYMDHAALALSASIGSVLHLLLLFSYLQKKTQEPLHLQIMAIPLLKTLAATATMTAALLALSWIAADFSKWFVLVQIGIGASLYILASWFFRNPHYLEMAGMITKRLTK